MGATLWRTLTSHYRFDDVGGLEMLTQLCGAIDRVEALAQRIRTDLRAWCPARPPGAEGRDATARSDLPPATALGFDC
jgi:hypothetical protein